MRTTLYLPGGGTRVFNRRFWYGSSDGGLDSVSFAGPVTLLSRGFAYNTQFGRVDSLRLGSAGWTRFGFDGELLPTVTRFPQDSIARGLLPTHEVSVVNSLVHLCA